MTEFSQRGASCRVCYNHLISNKREWNNCLNLHCFSLTNSDAQIVKIKFSSFYLEIFSSHTLWLSIMLSGVAFSNSSFNSGAKQFSPAAIVS